MPYESNVRSVANATAATVKQFTSGAEVLNDRKRVRDIFRKAQAPARPVTLPIVSPPVTARKIPCVPVAVPMNVAEVGTPAEEALRGNGSALAMANRVAREFGISVDQLLYSTDGAGAVARLACAGLVCRIHRVSVDDAVRSLGIVEAAILDGIRAVDAVLRDQVIPIAAPVDMVVSLVVTALREARPAARAFVRVEDIKKTVAREFSNLSVTIGDLNSARRTQPLTHVRQFAMALTKELTPRSLPEIGRLFGGRDHTTVLYACRRFEPIIARLHNMVPEGAGVEEWVAAAARHWTQLLTLLNEGAKARKLGV
jgi:hypothetical protein